MTFDRAIHSDTDAVEFVFHAARPVHDRAGQHGIWLLKGGGGKPFTFASPPGSPDISLVTTLGSASRFKRALAALRPGDRLRVASPLGTFVIDPHAEEVVMLAQGIGISPFLSMLRGSRSAAFRPITTLLHVGTHHYRLETDAGADLATYAHGRSAFAESLQDTIERRPTAQYLVSGAPAFVKDTTRSLRAAGITPDRIGSDKFYGVSSAHTSTAAVTTTA